MARNGVKTGGGSRKGRPNKHPISFREQLRQYCASIGVDPFRYMADLIANQETVVIGVDAGGMPLTQPAVPTTTKFNAAKELATFLEPKLKSVEVTGAPDNPLHYHFAAFLDAFEHVHGPASAMSEAEVKAFIRQLLLDIATGRLSDAHAMPLPH
jgi:hypothetical protein